MNLIKNNCLLCKKNLNQMWCPELRENTPMLCSETFPRVRYMMAAIDSGMALGSSRCLSLRSKMLSFPDTFFTLFKPKPIAATRVRSQKLKQNDCSRMKYVSIQKKKKKQKTQQPRILYPYPVKLSYKSEAEINFLKQKLWEFVICSTDLKER